MGVAVNARPGHAEPRHKENAHSSDNKFMMVVPLLDLMKDDGGHDRTFKRYRVNFPLSIHTDAEEAAVPGLAHNISLSGIGFVCLGRFDPESLVEIGITLETQAYLLLASIRRRRQLDLPGDSMYHYGTQFVRTEAVLQFIPAAAEFLLAQGGDQGGTQRVSRAPSSRPSRTPATSPVG